jgi:hypothetical protein
LRPRKIILLKTVAVLYTFCIFFTELTLWHAGFSRPRPATFNEEFNIVSCPQALDHISVQHGSVDYVLASSDRVDFPLDVKGAITSQQPTKIQIKDSFCARRWVKL